MRLPLGVIDSATYKVGSVETLEALLDVGFGVAALATGAVGATMGSAAAMDWAHAFLGPARPKWANLEGHVIVDLEEGGIRLHQRGEDGGRAAEVAWLPFGTFACRLHHYPFEVTVDLESREYGSCWLQGKSGAVHLAPARVARLVADEARARGTSDRNPGEWPGV